MPESKLSSEQWETVRSHWELSPRPGFAWIVRDLSLTISPQFLGRKAAKECWMKMGVEAINYTQPKSTRAPIAAPNLDNVVVEALFKSALGLHVVKEYQVIDGETITIKRRIPPSVEAQIFWLSTRAPDAWQGKWDVRRANEKPEQVEIPESR